MQISKMWQKGAHFQHLHIKKCKGMHDGEASNICEIECLFKALQLRGGGPKGPGGHQVVYVASMVKKVSSLLVCITRALPAVQGI